jgi:hypothetical protein
MKDQRSSSFFVDSTGYSVLEDSRSPARRRISNWLIFFIALAVGLAIAGLFGLTSLLRR